MIALSHISALSRAPCLIRVCSKMRFCQKRKFQYDGWYQAPLTNTEPLVKDSTALVLGWAGAQPKYVQSYSKMYSGELGIGAHGYILPMELTFNYDQSAQRRLAEEMVKVVSQENSGKKIFIHCFSNNGMNFYKHVSQILKERPHG